MIGSTPFANDYEFEFASELVIYEKLGDGPATDLLAISLSANDILGHQVGPDSPEMAAMALALDRELADFFDFLGHQIGLANVWIALSADHGVAPVCPMPQRSCDSRRQSRMRVKLERNQMRLTAKFSPGHAPTTSTRLSAIAWLNDKALSSAARKKEQEAERAVGEAMKQVGLRAITTQARSLAEAKCPTPKLGCVLHTATRRRADGM